MPPPGPSLGRRRGGRGRAAALLCAALAVAGATAGCAPPARSSAERAPGPVAAGGPVVPAGGVAPVAVDRATCASEAVLLARGVPVLAAPAPGAEPVRSLPRHAPVYLCGGAGEYRGVMFPAPGQRAVCGRRGKGGGACPTGWVREPLPVELAG